jgi:uncharacterized protein (TIGR00369 family)
MTTTPLDAAAMQAIMDGSPFIRFHQMTVEGCDPAAGTVTVAMPYRAELERGEGTGQFHGGAIASLIDTAGDFALVMGLGGGVPTINFRVDYLRPAIGQRLVATATVRRAGRTVGVVDVDVIDAQGKLVAVGRGTYSTTVG